MLLAGTMILAGAVAFGGSFAQAQQRTPTPTPAATPASTGAVASPATRTAATPAATASATQTYQGIPAGFTAEGNPFLGSLDAPVVLHEFSDYLCPFCARHFGETYPLLLENYIARGDVLLVFHDFPLASLHPTAYIGHRAARCVAEQDVAAYWAMHDLLFERQNEWNRLPDPTAFVTTLAAELEVDVDAFATCMESEAVAAAVDAGIADGDARGFNATPSFVIERPADGYSFELIGAYPYARFAEVIDALLAGEAPPAEPTPEPPQLPYWAGEGLAPDPDRPGFTLAGDPYKGSEDAPLTVVEFSDFQCPACARHVINVQPALDEQFVETGKVRWVFKNLPLRMHPFAPAAAAAAECAGDAGVFWEFHDRLFETQEQWAVEAVDDEILTIAEEFDFDLESFERCFMGRSGLERVLPDLYDAAGVASATPTYVIIAEGSGTIVSGAQQVSTFTEIIDAFIGRAESSKP